MVVESCPFNPVCDLKPVEQYGFIDLKTALDSCVVPSQMPDSETDYNGIEEPEQIAGKPSDIFEAIDAQKAIEASASDSGKSSKDE